MVASSTVSVLPPVPMCSLAERIPKVKPTGNSSKDFVFEEERKAFVAVLNILTAHPQYKTSCKDFLVRCMEDAAREKLVEDEDRFQNQIKNLGKVPDDWVCAWLSKRTGLSMTVLGKIKAFDSSQIQQLWLVELGASAQMKLPDQCNQKLVLARVATKRADARGALLKEAKVKDNVGPDGKVNWAVIGEFSFTKTSDGKYVKSLTHKVTKSKIDVPDDLYVSMDFDLRDNWSMTKATFKKGPRQYKAMDFWQAGKGPKSSSSKPLAGDSEIWKALMTEVMDDIRKQKAEQESGSVEVDTAALEGALKEKRLAATKRAREELEKARLENEAKRRLTVAQAVV